MEGQTLAEKILSKKLGRKVAPGEIVALQVDIAMAHDGTAPLAIQQFRRMGLTRVWDSKRVVLVIDHVAPSSNEGTSELHSMIREFAREHSITVYDVGEGICHQLLPEKGHVYPGAIIVGADSHTCTHGAFAAFATGIGSTEMAAVLGSGKIWFMVPESLKVVITGKPRRNVTAKDIILHIIGELGADGATYMAVEFTGDAVKEMSIDSRMTLTNMAVEMGAKTGLIASDERTLEYLRGRTSVLTGTITPDSNASYADELTVEAGRLEPVVACPHNVDNVKGVSEVEGTPVDQVFIGSCTNGRLEDLRVVARVLKNRRVKARTIVMPASREVYLKALQEGIIETLVKAGCAVGVPGCGPCVGGHHGIPGPNENVVATINRNFKGRMGNSKANIYLASPLVAAYAALYGKIVYPERGVDA
uniref:3-isopropylmalate dehydratase large subunit n=1 Tax=Fervidicoccus fontis TaxID=683846 RepID=A0A7J3ZLH0_9CREN